MSTFNDKTARFLVAMWPF